MKNSPPPTPVAVLSRELHVRDPDGVQHTGLLSIHFYQKDAIWVCEYNVERLPFHPTRSTSYGADAFHAFFLFLQHFRFLVSEHERFGYSIWWMEEGDHGDFRFKDFDLSS